MNSKKSNDPKGHHYVSEMILKNFSNENSKIFSTIKKMKSMKYYLIIQIMFSRETAYILTRLSKVGIAL